MVVNGSNNIAAFIANNSLSKSIKDNIASIYKISTGNSIYTPSDDIAGLALGSKARVEIASIEKTLSNLNQATSLLSIADHASENILQILTRQSELALQASSSILDNIARNLLNLEFQALAEQINLIAKETNFNNITLLDGSLYNNSRLTSDISYNSDSGSLNLTALDLRNGKTITLNGVKFTAKTSLANDGSAEFLAAPTTSAADNIIAVNNLALAANNYNDYRLKIANFTADNASPTFTINLNIQGATANMFKVGDSTPVTGDTALFSGWYSPNLGGNSLTSKNLSKNSMKVSGLSNNNISVEGIIGNNILTNLSGIKASGIIDLTNLTTANAAISSNNQRTISTTPGNMVNGPTGSNYAIVKLANHGFTNDTIINIDGSDLTLNGLNFVHNTNLLVNVIDKNSFALIASSGIAGSGTSNIVSPVSIKFDQQININGSVIKFKSTPSAYNEISLGSTASQSAANLVNYLNNSKDANIAIANYSLDNTGTKININYKTTGDNGNNYYISTASPLINFTNLSSNNNLQNGSFGGIDISGIANNSDFIGKISNFQATYSGTANHANLSVKIGDYTYRAFNVDSSYNASTNRISFISDNVNGYNGGYFTIELAATNGQIIANNTDAQLFADKISSAFSGLNFSQTRNITNYNPIGDVIINNNVIGSLNNTKFEITTDNFSDQEINSINFQAPIAPGLNGSLSIKINNDIYSNNSIINGIISKGQIITLTNQNAPSKKINFYNNASIDQDFSNKDNAASFSKMFQNALQLNQGKSKLSLELSNDPEAIISLSLKSAKTSDLYLSQGNSVDLNIATQIEANNSNNVIKNAIDQILYNRAMIGATQARVDYSANIAQTTIENLEAVSGNFLDTDMSSESVKLAISQVRMQASIAMLSQANNISKNILKLFD